MAAYGWMAICCFLFVIWLCLGLFEFVCVFVPIFMIIFVFSMLKYVSIRDNKIGCMGFSEVYPNFFSAIDTYLFVRSPGHFLSVM